MNESALIVNYDISYIYYKHHNYYATNKSHYENKYVTIMLSDLEPPSRKCSDLIPDDISNI